MKDIKQIPNKLTKEGFLEKYYEGLSDTKISEIFECSRRSVCKIRNMLKLPTNTTYRYVRSIKSLAKQGYNDSLIANELNINAKKVYYIRTCYNIPAAHTENVYTTLTDRRKGYMIRNVKFSAKRRGLDFNLNYSDLELPKYCPILGIKLNYTTKYQDFDHATIDRINNSKGYIKGNIIIISRLANIMKNQASFSEIKIFSKNILKLINYYENQGALGSITDIFPNTEMYEET